jgi:hypothetical protein
LQQDRLKTVYFGGDATILKTRLLPRHKSWRVAMTRIFTIVTLCLND